MWETLGNHKQRYDMMKIGLTVQYSCSSMWDGWEGTNCREGRILEGIQVWEDKQKLMSCRSEFWTGWKAHISHKMKRVSEEGSLIVSKGPYKSDILHSCYLLCNIFWYSTLIRNPLQTAWVRVIIWANLSSLISSRRPRRPALKKTFEEKRRVTKPTPYYRRHRHGGKYLDSCK